MTRAHRFVLAACCVFSWAAPRGAAAHATLLTPKPRTPLTLKTGPCGGIPKTDAPLEVEAGSELEVVWQEYVDHPGFYRILYSSAGDADFVPLLDNIPDRKPSSADPETYSAVVRLPAEPSDEGTLLLIQVMMENPAQPRLYYSCADLKLVSPASPPAFRRGDVNSDGRVDISDAVNSLESLFLGDEPSSCPDAADANDDGKIDLSDAIATLRWLFSGGPELASPGPRECGADPTADLLPGCGASSQDCKA